MNPLFPKVELPPEPKGWTYGGPDPDPLHVEDESPLGTAYMTGFEDGRARHSSSKVVLLALGVGAALGFVAGWALR